MKILGVNTGHDSGVCLIIDGVFVEVINEERFSGYKSHHGIPYRSIAYVKNKYTIDAFDSIITISADGRYQTPLFGDSENELLRKRGGEKLFGKSILYKLRILPIWRKFKYTKANYGKPKMARNIQIKLKELFPVEKITNLDHHLAHAWSALAFTKKPQNALIITLDGEGDGLCGSVNTYRDGNLNRELAIPTGVGIGTLYGKVTEFVGMRRNEHEYKIMGLAPYAKEVDGQKVLEYFRKLIWINKEEGTFESSMNVQYAKYRFLIDNLSNHRFDSVAWGIQKFTEELVLEFIAETLKKYDAPDVYFSGGVFMNIKLNQIIKSQISDRNLYFTPSCGDESLAIGAAKFGYDNATNSYSQNITGLYLGTEYSDEEIATTLNKLDTNEFIITNYTKDEFGVEQAVASLLAKNEIVARFKGRMEWGARALGNRSILANPSDLNAVKKINEAIKNRDFWMPFAPTILDTHADSILFNQSPSPYMTLGFNTKPHMIPKLNACVHSYDGTCRPQILTRNVNPEYYQLITNFADYSDIGGVLNTSFNLHGKPIVESPADAIETLKQSGLRHLAIGNYLVSKK